MALSKLGADVENISALDDLPNDNDGLSATELKALFDKAGVDIKAFLNDVLIPELEVAIDAAASGIAQAETLSGDKLTDNSIMANKLSSLEGAQAVTTDVVRDYAITQQKLSSALQTLLSGHTSSITSLTNGMQTMNTNLTQAISNLQSATETTTNALSVNKQDKAITYTVTLTAGQNTWTAQAANVTENNIVLVSAAPASWEQYSYNGIHVTAQGTGTLSFAGWSNPTSDVVVNVLILP